MANKYQRGSKQWHSEKMALQQRLDRCLEGMADHEFAEPEEIVRAAAELCGIYADGEFRHRYSNIAGVIEKSTPNPVLDSVADAARKERLKKFGAEIQAEQSRAACLASNLRTLIMYDPDGLSKIVGDEPILKIQQDERLEKLYDHVSLEAKRSGYNAGSVRMMLEELNEARALLSDTKQQVEEAERSASEAKDKAASLQRETIAILGVFSAITLAFNAGVSFTTSSFSELNTVAPNIFQIAFVVGVVGFFLLNILYASFAFVHRLVSEKRDRDALKFLPTGIVVLVEAAALAFIAVFCMLAMGSVSG